MWSRPEPGPPSEALLEDHVAELRKEAKQNLGILPPDLTVLEGYPPAAYSVNALSAWTKVERTTLYFLGVTDDQICFSHTLVDRNRDVTAAGQPPVRNETRSPTAGSCVASRAVARASSGVRARSRTAGRG